MALALTEYQFRKSGSANALSWIPDRARELESRGLFQGRSWTLSQVCEHLALAIESTIAGSAAQEIPRRWRVLSRIEQLKRWCIKKVMLSTGWFPSGVEAPASVAPIGSQTLPDALDRLDHAVAAFERKYQSRNATWNYHSILGRMTGRNWRRFHTIHAAHHFSFFSLKPLPY